TSSSTRCLLCNRRKWNGSIGWSSSARSNTSTRRLVSKSVEARNDRVVIAEMVPIIATQHHTGLKPLLPCLRHEKAVTVVRDGAISGPAKRLVQRLMRVRCLPAVEQAKLVGQSRLDRQVLLAGGPLWAGPVAHGEIEVAADDYLPATGNSADLVKNLVDLLP